MHQGQPVRDPMLPDRPLQTQDLPHSKQHHPTPRLDQVLACGAHTLRQQVDMPLPRMGAEMPPAATATPPLMEWTPLRGTHTVALLLHVALVWRLDGAAVGQLGVDRRRTWLGVCLTTANWPCM